MILSWLKVSAVIVAMSLVSACSSGSSSKLTSSNQNVAEQTPVRDTQGNSYQAIDLAAISDVNLRSCVLATGATITNVQSLNCTSRGITSLQGIEQFQDLRVLTLNSNSLTDIGVLSQLTKLHTLDIRHNQVSAVDALKDLKFLDTLAADHNQISSIDVLAGSSITRLYVSNNQISSLSALADITQLKNLTAENNQAPIPNKMPSSLETFRI